MIKIKNGAGFTLGNVDPVPFIHLFLKSHSFQVTAYTIRI